MIANGNLFGGQELWHRYRQSMLAVEPSSELTPTLPTDAGNAMERWRARSARPLLRRCQRLLQCIRIGEIVQG